MQLVHYDKLSSQLKLEARTFHAHLGPNWSDWLIPIRKDGHVSHTKGTHSLTEEAYQRHVKEYEKGPRTKGDLSNWKPGTTFHLVRD